MNVHITCTPDFSEELLDNVVDTLNQTPGVIKFHKSPVKSKDHFDDYLAGFNDYSRLSNDQFYKVCKVFRRQNSIPEEDYFVLISDKLHSSNWFSAFRETNVFVIGSDWEFYTRKDYRYPISYQIIENLFQSLINLRIEKRVDDIWEELPFNELDQRIHFDKHTCINSMCADKTKISDKFIAGFICDDCYESAKNEISNPLILSHIEALISDLRNRYVTRGESPEKVVLPIEVNEDGKISVGDVEISLNAQPKSFYIHFLESSDKIKTLDISKKEFVQDVFKIYKQLNKKGEIFRVATKVGWARFNSRNELLDEKDLDNKDNLVLTNVIRDFEKVRSMIRTSIVKSVGENFSRFYEISMDIYGDTHFYSILVDKEKRIIRLKI